MDDTHDNGRIPHEWKDDMILEGCQNDDSISPKGVEPTLSLRHAFCCFGTFWTLDGDLFVQPQPDFENEKYYTPF